MSKADEMFEKLGYEYNEERDIFDNIKEFYILPSQLKEIVFYHKDRKIACCQYYDCFDYITMQELQAINEKVKELGWNKKEN